MTNDKKFYVYEWYNTNTNEVFYVGKGCGKRYLDVQKRNKKFKDYIKENEVDVRIIKDNLIEQDAFNLEKIITNNYKKINQCICNLAEAGYGECHFIWTEEMRKYWSEYNPMKQEEQKERMKNNNPMKNKEIALKNGVAHKRKIYIGKKEFDGIIDAQKFFNQEYYEIKKWLDKGLTPNNEKCGYLTEKRNGRGTKVLIDGILYNSIAEASKIVGVSATALRNALNKDKKEYQGHICEYANQQPS